MKIPDLKNIIYNEKALIDFLLENDMVIIPVCSRCQEPMTHINIDVTSDETEKRSKDTSLLRGSFFQSIHLSAKEILVLLCEWCKGSSNLSASIELDVMPSTITRWYDRFNKLVFDFLSTFIHSQQIGGEDCIVEIDETVLVKNKYHRDRLLEYQVWAVVRGNRIHFFIEKSMIDHEIIRRKTAPGSLILTDMWRGYLGLETICIDLGFRHQTVNHSENFVDVETGAHTQTIEGM